MKRYSVAAALLVGLAPHLTAAEPASLTTEIHTAVERALPLIQKGGAGHMTQRTCFACHNQAIPVFALTTARSRGFAVKDEEIQQHLRFIVEFLDRNRDKYREGIGQGGQVDTAGYALWTLEAGGWKPDKTTAAVAEYLLQRDQKRDHWRCTSDRPPSETSRFTTTYLAIRALQSFGTVEQKPRIDERLCVVRGWLTKTPARDNEDRVFRLWAMKRLECDADVLRAAARELSAAQRPDGGWSQTEAMKSDAYATGTALAALHHAAGLATTDAIYQRGVKFLLRTQQIDGTWRVPSRSKPFQTYFESGFPYRQDQFISLSASAWATTALAFALPVGIAATVADKPVSLFDGKTFEGWDGDIKKTWRIVDGCLVGGSLTEKVPRNQFLATKRDYGDFILRLKFKLLGDSKKGFVNSGVQFRSERVPEDTEMIGYQADLGDPSWWGCIYDESRRKKVLAQSDMEKINKVLKRGDWNDYEIRAEGRRIRTYINGVQAVDYTEKDEKIPQKGKIGLQIHGGGPAEVWFKDITIEELRPAG